MRTIICLGLATLGLCLASKGKAFEFENPGLPPGCRCEKGYYEKVVKGVKPEWREKTVEVMVMKPFCREEVRQTTQMVPKEFVEKRLKVIDVPRDEVRDVVKCRPVPVRMIDPDTGCSVICIKNEKYTTKAVCPVIDKKTVVVDVKVCRQVPQVVDVKVMVKDYRPEKVLKKERFAVMVPYEKVVRCPCPPFGPNYRVEQPVRPNGPVGTPPPPVAAPHCPLPIPAPMGPATLSPAAAPGAPAAPAFPPPPPVIPN